MSMALAKLQAEAKAAKQKIPDRVPAPDYSDDMTKQSFKDECDINQILKKAQKEKTIAHLQKYDQAVYGQFEGLDLLEAHNLCAKAKQIFSEAPSEIRNEFNQDPFAFAAYCSNPENKARLGELLPALAQPGRYFPNPVKRGGQGAGLATAPQEAPVEPPTSGDGPESPAAEAGMEPASASSST